MIQKKIRLIAVSLLLIISPISCTYNSETQIIGTIDYIGDADIYIEIKPLHYKYSNKERFLIDVKEHSFELRLPIKESNIVYLVIQDEKYPLYVVPDEKIMLTIKRSSFPFDVVVEGNGEDENIAYQNFLEESKGLDNAIKIEMDKFKMGKPNRAIEISEQKVEIARKNLKHTYFNDLYLKSIGEDFVIKLRAIEYSSLHITNFDVEGERQKLLDQAVNSGFFSYNSLKAQRAGIRDFTHYYSRTFGIYDRVNAAHGKVLAEYDIKRVAYDELNEKRMFVVNLISDAKSKAYAELFLVAERIGEIPLSLAKKSYQDYLKNYADYPEFIEFITTFYTEVESVSPGADAIPFTLYDRTGKPFSMNDFLGTYVLLDFWAGWCKPCLEEFPSMRTIYDQYSRKELEIVGISTEIDSLLWLSDLEKFKNPWPQLYGGNGFDQETFKAYKGGGIPFYILIDPEGKIVRYNDMRPSFNFTEVLDSLLIHQEIK